MKFGIRNSEFGIRNSSGGYTIPELLVVTIVTGLFVSLILFFTISYWRYGYLLEADLDSFITRLNAGDFLRENVGTSAGLIIQTSIPDNNVHNPDPLNPNHWQVIHAIPGTTNLPSSGTTPLVYWRRFSFNASGNVIMNGVQPYEDEFVLFLDGPTKQLRVRSLASPSAPGNRLKTSCPPASATPACPADKVVATDMAGVGLRYFSRTGLTIDYSSITDPDTGEYIGPDFPVVEVVEFVLNITKKPFFQRTNATINSTVVRIALRND